MKSTMMRAVRQRVTKLRLAKFALVLVVPAFLIALKNGPDPAVNGDPSGTPEACSLSGCHVGTTVNGGGGSIRLTSSTGAASYTPGVKQTFTLTIIDSSARLYGFQASARLASNKAQAGTFTAQPGSNTFVQCSDGRTRPAAGCAASASIEYIQHGTAPTTNRTGIFTFDWTPPASEAGSIVIYFAGNAANGDSDPANDHIYSGSLTLTSGSGSTPKPIISTAISAGAFGAFTTFTGGSWIEIYGSNLASTTRQWQGSDFSGSNAPKSLDNVSVTVNGKPAYVWVLVHSDNGDQLNVQAPTDGAISGNASIVVTNNGQSSDPFTMGEDSQLTPGLLAPDSFKIGGKQFIVGVLSTTAGVNTYACPPNSIAGVICKLPKPGDLITFYGVGFGPTVDNIPAGVVTPSASKLSNSLTWQFGSTQANVLFGGLAPFAVGLYQFNVTVPSVAAGQYAMQVRVGGVVVPQTMVLQVGQ